MAICRKTQKRKWMGTLACFFQGRCSHPKFQVENSHLIMNEWTKQCWGDGVVIFGLRCQFFLIKYFICRVFVFILFYKHNKTNKLANKCDWISPHLLLYSLQYIDFGFLELKLSLIHSLLLILKGILCWELIILQYIIIFTKHSTKGTLKM